MRKGLDVRDLLIYQIHDLVEGLEHIQAFEIFRLRDLRVERGVEVEGWESLGVLYADLYIAASPALMTPLRAAMDTAQAKVKEPIFAPQIEVASARSRDNDESPSVIPPSAPAPA